MPLLSHRGGATDRPTKTDQPRKSHLPFKQTSAQAQQNYDNKTPRQRMSTLQGLGEGLTSRQNRE